MDEESLIEKQQRFSLAVTQLILKAHDMGYKITFGEAWRPPEMARWYAQQHKGIPNSLHCHRLAIDLNLFKGGVLLTQSEDHQPLGEWWESVGGTWGGRFGDGNHYSFAYYGCK